MKLIYRKGDSVRTARQVGALYGALVGLFLTGVATTMSGILIVCGVILVPLGACVGAVVMGIDAARLLESPEQKRITTHDR
jgi:hypothetical protein